MAPRMEWKADMIEKLLELVFYRKIHLMAHKAGAKEAWEQLTKDLFKQKEFAGAISHNVDGVERNIKKKYNDVLIEMRQEMATGNKSGLERDRSYSYRLAEGIDNEV